DQPGTRRARRAADPRQLHPRAHGSPAVPVHRPRQPRLADHQEQRGWAGEGRKELRHPHAAHHRGGGARRAHHPGAPAGVSRAGAHRAHHAQHVGRRARDRVGGGDRAEEGRHGGAVDGDLPRAPRHPGARRRVRRVHRHRCVRRRVARIARAGGAADGAGRRGADDLDRRLGRAAARLGPRRHPPALHGAAGRAHGRHRNQPRLGGPAPRHPGGARRGAARDGRAL
ncbi:MAG: FIG002283: Isochorismatase family protein, partial [uncultured Gemmatimonadetes bacterium]